MKSDPKESVFFEPKPLSSKQLGAYIALGSMTMLFGTLTLSYLLAYTRAKVWPPIGEEPLPYLGPTISCVVAFFSSLAIHQAYKSYLSNQWKRFRTFWLTGLTLGISFLISQYWLWHHLTKIGIQVTKSLWGSMVFGMIGIHAFHVILALPLLIWVFRSVPRIDVRWVERIQIVGWFWHFLGILWGVFYICLVWM